MPAFLAAPFFLSGVQDFVAWLIQGISEGFSTSNVISYGKLAGDSNFLMKKVWELIGGSGGSSGAFSVVQPIGVALAVTVFILNLIDLASKDNATFENFVKLILNIIFTIATISMAPQIINVFIGVNDGLVDSLKGIGPSIDNTFNIGALDAGLGVIEALVTIVVLLIPWLVGLIADLAIMFPLISRCLEVAWRCAFFPIGVSNFTGGAQSPAIRYIKNLISVLLVGAFFIVVIKIGSSMVVSIMNYIFNGTADFGSEIANTLFQYDPMAQFMDKLWAIIRGVLLAIVIKFATLGVMMSGSRVMKEVIG